MTSTRRQGTSAVVSGAFIFPPHSISPIKSGKVQSDVGKAITAVGGGAGFQTAAE